MPRPEDKEKGKKWAQERRKEKEVEKKQEEFSRTRLASLLNMASAPWAV